MQQKRQKVAVGPSAVSMTDESFNGNVAVPAVLAAAGESSMRRVCRVKMISLLSGRVSATRIHTRAERS